MRFLLVVTQAVTRAFFVVALVVFWACSHKPARAVANCHTRGDCPAEQAASLPVDKPPQDSPKQAEVEITTPPTPPLPLVIAPEITPKRATLTAGQKIQFRTNIAAEGDIEWGVLEESARHAIARDGTFTAPSVAGTFHVVAQKKAAPSYRDIAVVEVALATVPEPPPPEPEPVNKKQIALTFDDAPKPSDHYYTGAVRTDVLIRKLAAAKVQAAFLVIGANINDESAKRLRLYGRAGHVIANHTFHHMAPEQMGTEAYIESIRLADSMISDFTNFKRWFRFPYLSEGQTAEVRDALRNALKQMNYMNAHVTVSNWEWYIDERFQDALARAQDIDLNKLRDLYLDVLWQCIQFYEALSQKALHRSPKHVLLLHETDVTALFVDDLIDFLHAAGWSIISPEEAFKDSITDARPKIVPVDGSIITQIAREKEVPGPYFSDSENYGAIDRLFSDIGLPR